MLSAPSIWVLDTNVALDWLIFADPGVSRLVAWVEAGRARLVTSARCRAELERVLDYPRLPATPLQRSAALSAYDRWTCVCASLEGEGRHPHPRSQRVPLPVCRDPDDQKFLELAQDASADWLISKDKLLLKLARQTRTHGLFEVLHPRAATAALVDCDRLAQARDPAPGPDPGDLGGNGTTGA